MTSKETDAMWRTRSEQPEALILADYLTACPTLAAVAAHEAAAELRRLHAVNTELLEALKAMLENKSDYTKLRDTARAAIAKATGEQA